MIPLGKIYRRTETQSSISIIVIVCIFSFLVCATPFVSISSYYSDVRYSEMMGLEKPEFPMYTLIGVELLYIGICIAICCGINASTKARLKQPATAIAYKEDLDSIVLAKKDDIQIIKCSEIIKVVKHDYSYVRTKHGLLKTHRNYGEITIFDKQGNKYVSNQVCDIADVAEKIKTLACIQDNN